MPVRYLAVGAQHCCAPSRQDAIRPVVFSALLCALRFSALSFLLASFLRYSFHFFLRTLLSAFLSLALSEFPRIGCATLFCTMTPLCPNSLSSAPQAL